jgi:hypothetical protein
MTLLQAQAGGQLAPARLQQLLVAARLAGGKGSHAHCCEEGHACKQAHD